MFQGAKELASICALVQEKGKSEESWKEQMSRCLQEGERKTSFIRSLEQVMSIMHQQLVEKETESKDLRRLVLAESEKSKKLKERLPLLQSKMATTVSRAAERCSTMKAEAQNYQELATEKVSKASWEVQPQNVSKELCEEVSVLRREVATAREVVEEQELELETLRMRDVSRNEVPRNLQKAVGRRQGTSETLKKELGVFTKLGKEIWFRQKAFQKQQLILAQDLVGDWMPIERLYQLWRVEQDLMEYQCEKRSMHPDENFVSRQATGPTSRGVEAVAPDLPGEAYPIIHASPLSNVGIQFTQVFTFSH